MKMSGIGICAKPLWRVGVSAHYPTIGLLLCSETSKDLARYSILKDSKQIYTAKYLTYLPSKEQLAAEIIKQKEIFELQTGKKFN